MKMIVHFDSSACFYYVLSYDNPGKKEEKKTVDESNADKQVEHKVRVSAITSFIVRWYS